MKIIKDIILRFEFPQPKRVLVDSGLHLLLWGYCNYRGRVLSWQHAPDHGAQKRWLDQMTDDTITAQIRRTILNKIESYEIEDLKAHCL